MANIAAYAEKAMLDWVFGGATPTRPGAQYVGLSLGAPSSISGSEIGTTFGYARQTGTFAAAATPAGSVSNANAMTFGPFTTAASFSGVQIWDTGLSANSGNMLWYGALATAATMSSGESYIIPAGSLVATLA